MIPSVNSETIFQSQFQHHTNWDDWYDREKTWNFEYTKDDKENQVGKVNMCVMNCVFNQLLLPLLVWIGSLKSLGVQN